MRKKLESVLLNFNRWITLTQVGKLIWEYKREDIRKLQEWIWNYLAWWKEEDRPLVNVLTYVYLNLYYVEHWLLQKIEELIQLKTKWKTKEMLWIVDELEELMKVFKS